MKLKENIKAKIDRLDPEDLRAVQLLLDSLTRKRSAGSKKTKPSQRPFQQVIDILDSQQLTTENINEERNERL